MDDRELETRLRTHFHRTIDDAQPSPELRATVRQVFATPVRRVGLFDLRRRLSVSTWGLAVAAVAIAAIAITAVSSPSIEPRPGAQPSTPATPLPAAVEGRRFVVVPTAGEVPDKGSTSMATDVLSARLHALGFDSFASGAGYGIDFLVPADGPSSDSTRRVLAATGDVEFVPLPETDYGEGKLAAEVGKPLPKDEPALFGWEGIESVEWGTDQQGRETANFTLKPAARAAFGDYTAKHVLGYLAVVIDGQVALLPTINEPIPNGEIQISSGDLPGSPGATRMKEHVAILIGGMLPERWRGATSPEILSSDAAIAVALGRYPMATAVGTSLYFAMHGTQPTPVWSVDLEGATADRCSDDAGNETPCVPGFTQVVLDAVTGQVVPF